MISIEPGQTWTTADGHDTITIRHSEESRWIVDDSAGEGRSMTASKIRSNYRIVEVPNLEE